MIKYNVVVAGGGMAGTAAAAAAARCGMSVLLIERGNALGGAAVNCLVNPFMPYRVKTDSGVKVLSGGIFGEIIERLREMSVCMNDPVYDGNTIFNEEYLKLILNRLVLSSGVRLLYHTVVTGAETENGRIKAVRIFNKSGEQKIYADYFIDATGDADLAVLAGCACRLGRPEDGLCQPMTLCFRLSNVDVEKYNEIRPRINEIYRRAQAEGRIKNPRKDVLIFHSIHDGVLHFNSTRITGKNPVNAAELTEAETEAREQVFELYEFMKSSIPGFENSRLLMSASSIGVRESRMIEGEYTLSAQDLMSCTAFEDAVAYGSYNMDIHDPIGGGTTHYHIPEGKFYSIPLRCLIPKGTDNLLAAGRCISATHEAQAAIRIMPTVCCIGEAAGTAAAAAVKHGCRVSECSGEVIAMLKKNGAVIFE